MPSTLKCANCGGDLKFTPSLQLWQCEWCDQKHTQADLPGFSAETDEAPGPAADAASRSGETDGGAIITYKCGYCGAEVVTADSTSQTFCVYCQRPVAILSRLSGEFKPDAVLPFKLVKENALEQYRSFLKGKRFLPNSYCSERNTEKLTGVYIPFWLFDGKVVFDTSGEGDIVTVSRQGDYRVTKTDTYRIRRSGQFGVREVPVDASSKTPSDVMDSIEPFDFSALQPFAAPYLSGFLAERFDISQEDSFVRAQKRMESSADKKINASLTRYKRVRKQKDEKRAEDITAKYGLLPVWILHSFYEDKDYLFAMNGQTGKMLGNLPVDKGKMFRFGLIVLAISGTACAAAGLLLKLLEVF
jgi:DNA-directed RNA polymerase subunit RPC12/RpoP